MPYICLTFDDTTSASMRQSADRIACGSAFVPSQPPLHVPLLGSLHVYAPEAVRMALAEANGTIRGRFVQWGIHASQLRASIELLDGADAVMQQLQRTLPRGRPWRTHYVSLGSVAEIDTAQHDAFLAAVNSAFPMDASAIFTAGALDYNDTTPPPTTSSAEARSRNGGGAKPSGGAKPTGLNPKARPFVPGQAAPLHSKTKQPRRRNNQPLSTSPHKKWTRVVKHAPAADAAGSTSAGGSTLDDLIMQTARTGARAAKAARRSAASRAARVANARTQTMADH